MEMQCSSNCCEPWKGLMSSKKTKTKKQQQQKNQSIPVKTIKGKKLLSHFEIKARYWFGKTFGL